MVLGEDLELPDFFPTSLQPTLEAQIGEVHATDRDQDGAKI
jgi:hypothetical protein